MSRSAPFGTVLSIAVGLMLFAALPVQSVPVQKEISLGDGLSISMTHIPGGDFLMGSNDGDPDEQPVHRVRVDPFWIGTMEVTNEQYLKFTDETGYDGSPSSQHEFLAHIRLGKGGEASTDPNAPVAWVNWHDAVAFTDWVSAKSGLDIRLPTEAEWEYAGRAGSTAAYSFGDDSSVLGDYAWYQDNSGGTNHLVGQKLPNDWGLYDMHGNVTEWIYDWYGEDYYSVSPVDNPLGPGSGAYRVIRGGGHDSSAYQTRVANRPGNFPDQCNEARGFRIYAPVPEPATITLLGIGLVAIYVIQRRKS